MHQQKKTRKLLYSKLKPVYGRSWMILSCLLIAMVGMLLLLRGHAASTFPTARDKTKWPFSKYSIWNMPIGSSATYHAVSLRAVDAIHLDHENKVVVAAGDPVRSVYQPNSYANRCSGGHGATPFMSFRIPDSLVIPGPDNYQENMGVAWLQPDGTVYETGTTARCTPVSDLIADGTGPPLFQPQNYGMQINNTGYYGGHGATILSTVGSALRPGDLTSTEPIRHALAIEPSGYWLHCDGACNNPNPWSINGGDGYVWPAASRDAGATNVPDTGQYSVAPSIYMNADPALKMGALYAVAPTINCDALVASTPGKKLCHALQDYGAYAADHSGYPWVGHDTSNVINFGIESGIDPSNDAATEYKNTFGYEPFSSNDPLANDAKTIFQNISIVTNNKPNAIGGGGNPRQCYAPPFSDGTVDALATNPNGSVAEPTNCNNPQTSSVITSTEAEKGSQSSKITSFANTGASHGSAIQFKKCISGICLPSGDVTSDGHTWHQIVAEDFTKDSALGTWGQACDTTAIYTGSTGVPWKSYPQCYNDTYQKRPYRADQVLSVHDNMLDFWLHTVDGKPAGANPSPVLPNGTQYQTYGRYEARMRQTTTNLSDYHQAWLLWPQSDADWLKAESDFPESSMSSPTASAFSHYCGSLKLDGSCTGAQDALNSSTLDKTQWHTYTQEWMPGKRNYYVDGVLVGSATNQIFSGPERWQLQTETNSQCDQGVINTCTQDGHLLVDWVSVYAY